MVSPRLRKHASEIVYLQKARPCVSKHIIDKADRSLIECLCDNILKGNVQLTPAQRDKLKKNRSGLRDLVKKSVSLKRRKPLLKKGTKTLGREAKRTGLNIAGDVVQGKNVKQAAQSRLKMAGKDLVNKAIGYAGPPGERTIKRPANGKGRRRRQTRQRNTSNDIFG